MEPLEDFGIFRVVDQSIRPTRFTRALISANAARISHSLAPFGIDGAPIADRAAQLIASGKPCGASS